MWVLKIIQSICTSLLQWIMSIRLLENISHPELEHFEPKETMQSIA